MFEIVGDCVVTRELSESTPAVIDVTQVDVARLSGKQTVAILSPLHCYRALRDCNRLLHWRPNEYARSQQLEASSLLPNQLYNEALALILKDLTSVELHYMCCRCSFGRLPLL